MKKVFLIASLYFASQNVFAGYQTGKITSIRVSSPTVSSPTHFQLNGTWNGQPACATSPWWAIDTDTPAGKSLLSILLTAYSTDKTVTVWGQGICSLRSDMETAIQVGL